MANKTDKTVDFQKDWKYEDLERYLGLAEKIAKEDLGLDFYPNQVELVTSDQMLERYSTIGLPISYSHWRYGMQYAAERQKYLKGKMGLAYELVINSNPCISYNMENNDLCTMILVLAHAACGHNAFFKMNYMFKDNTDAEFIISYVHYANKYIEQCIQKYGEIEVETWLDACHSLENLGVNKYRNVFKKKGYEEERLKNLILQQDKEYDPLMTTAPGWKQKDYWAQSEEVAGPASFYDNLDEENLLLFVEQHSPFLPQWKREIIRIVRNIAQYFYPQSQTKVANEGTATAVHYYIFNKLWEQGHIPEHLMMDFIKLHTGVVFQPPYNSKYYSGINPYYLGFNIFQDVKRICEKPTEEDVEWFPKIAGKADWKAVWRDMICNYRDDSLILQFLSPKLMREMEFFSGQDFEDEEVYFIKDVTDKKGYENLRRDLAEQYNRARFVPDIRIKKANIQTNRALYLEYYPYKDMGLSEKDANQTLNYLAMLWGYPVSLRDVGSGTLYNSTLRSQNSHGGNTSSNGSGLNFYKTSMLAKTISIRTRPSPGMITSVTIKDEFRHDIEDIVAISIGNTLLDVSEYDVVKTPGEMTAVRITPNSIIDPNDQINIVYVYKG